MNCSAKLIILVATCFAACTTLSETKENPATATWEKLGPGGGGATFIPTFSHQSPENFMIRCDMTGAYLTSNGGKSYQQVNFANGSSAFANDPNNSNTIYIGDEGNSWKWIKGYNFKWGKRVDTDPNDSQQIMSSPLAEAYGMARRKEIRNRMKTSLLRC